MKGNKLVIINLIVIFGVIVFLSSILILNPEMAYNVGAGIKRSTGYFMNNQYHTLEYYEPDLLGVWIFSITRGLLVYLLFLSWNLGAYTVHTLHQERKEKRQPQSRKTYKTPIWARKYNSN